MYHASISLLALTVSHFGNNVPTYERWRHCTSTAASSKANGIVNSLLVRRLYSGLFNFIFLLLLPLYILANLLFIQTYKYPRDHTASKRSRPVGSHGPVGIWEQSDRSKLIWVHKRATLHAADAASRRRKGMPQVRFCPRVEEGYRMPHTGYCREEGPNLRSWGYSHSPTGSCSTA